MFFLPPHTLVEADISMHNSPTLLVRCYYNNHTISVLRFFCSFGSLFLRELVRHISPFHLIPSFRLTSYIGGSQAWTDISMHNRRTLLVRYYHNNAYHFGFSNFFPLHPSCTRLLWFVGLIRLAQAMILNLARMR